MIDLVPITDDAQIDAFMRATASQYTEDLIKSLDLDEEEAALKSRRDMAPILERKFDAKGHHLFHTQLAKSGENVGATWLVVEQEIRTAWIYYILIYEEHRGKGLGTATILRLHSMARDMGCDQVSLYVYQHNSHAQALYRKVGYQDSAYFLRLPLCQDNLD